VDTLWYQSLPAVLAIALVHLASGSRRVREATHWLIPIGAGIALSYAFLHLLPELAELQKMLLEGPLRQRPLLWLDIHVYLFALGGMLLFYILEGFRKSAIRRIHNASFWIEITVFSLYNFLIGYLTEDAVANTAGLVLIAIAFGAHFLGSDLDLAEQYPNHYPRFGGWLQALALVAGWAMGRGVGFSEVAVGAGFAFLAGGLIMNTIRTELPNPHIGRNGRLILGVVLYTILMLLIKAFSQADAQPANSPDGTGLSTAPISISADVPTANLPVGIGASSRLDASVPSVNIHSSPRERKKS
jgi:hypothetical protein